MAGVVARSLASLHPRLAINPVSLGSRRTTVEYLATLTELGAPRAGEGRPRLVAEGWDEPLERFAASGVALVYLSYNVMYDLSRPETWEDANRDIRRAIDAGRRFGWVIYGVTGPGPALGLTWEESAEAFMRAVAPVAAYARERGVPLSLEPTLSLFSDLHFVHTQRDVVDLCEAADMYVTYEVNASWNERDLRATIERAGPRLCLVQLSDYVPSSRSLNRAVPGDGAIALERILSWILETGYEGLFDLELWGDPDRHDEVDALVRAADHVGRLLERLGA